MPNGYGVADAGDNAGETIGKLKPTNSTSGDTLGRAAIDASIALAKAEGKVIPKPALPKTSSGGGGGSSPLLVFGVPVFLLALGGLLATIRARQREGDSAETAEAAETPAKS